MYLISLSPLKELLRNRALTERKALPYFITFMIAAIALSLLPIKGEYNSGWYALNLIVNIALTIGGTVYCFMKNGGNSGYDFIQKSIVLGWVIGIRIVLPLYAIMFLIYYFIEMKHGYVPGKFPWISIVNNAVLLTIFYQRLGRHLKDTNQSIE